MKYKLRHLWRYWRKINNEKVDKLMRAGRRAPVLSTQYLGKPARVVAERRA